MSSREPAGHVPGVLAWWSQAGEAADILHLDGELDALTAPALRESVTSLPKPGRSLVVDLEMLRFCGATGLRLFLELRARALSAGGTVRLASAASGVRRAVEVTGLTDVLSIDRDVNAAVSALTEME